MFVSMFGQFKYRHLIEVYIVVSVEQNNKRQLRENYYVIIVLLLLGLTCN